MVFSPEWVRKWVRSLIHFLRPTFSRQKRKKRPEISRFQVFYGCGGRTRTCGLRVMSCSETPIPCNARISRIFYPRKSRKTRRPSVFVPRPTSGLSRKWVGIWVRADSSVSRNEPLKQRRGFFSSALHNINPCNSTKRIPALDVSLVPKRYPIYLKSIKFHPMSTHLEDKHCLPLVHNNSRRFSFRSPTLLPALQHRKGSMA